MASSTVNKNTGKLSNGTVLFLEWKIQDFLSLYHKADHPILSPKFHFKGQKWCLRLYPNGQTAKKSIGYIDIYLQRYCSDDSLIHRVNYHLGISKNDGTLYESWHAEKDFERDASFWGVFKLVDRSVVSGKDNDLAPSGEVTVFCYLQVKSERTSDVSTQSILIEDNDECNEIEQEILICDQRTDNDECNETEQETLICDQRTGAHKLAKNLKDLLLSKEECDITLKVKSQEFQAHKAILVARSSVFRAIFRHEMTEKLSGEVNIPDCDPDAFQLFLIHLYTGAVEGISSNNVFNLYGIANKYDAMELKMNCTQYMKNSLSVDTVCDIITHSLLYTESDLLDMATDFFTKHFKDIIVTVKWLRFLEENLITANELLIKASKYHVPPT